MRILEVVLFAVGVAALWGMLAPVDVDPSDPYIIGWPGATVVFAAGVAALAAKAAVSLVRGAIRNEANERRRQRRLAARSELPEWTDFAFPLTNLARHAHMVLDELARGEPLEGEVLLRVSLWRNHIAKLEAPARHALERRGIHVDTLISRLEDAMAQTRGDPGSEVDRIVSTFLVAAATEVRSLPYRG